MQKGHLPLKGRAGELAKRLPPEDVREFAATQEKGLPDRVEPKQSSVLYQVSCWFRKQADVAAALQKAEKALHQVHATRRKALQTYTDKLRQHAEKLQAKAQESDQRIADADQRARQAEAKATQAETQAQQAIAQAEVPPTSPPPAQPPYGAMLTGQMQEEDEKGSAPALPKVPDMKAPPKIG